MKKSMFFILVLSCMYQLAYTQAEARFECSVSSDSILFGNYFEVRYTLEQVEATQFQTPDFEYFEIVGGPNTSTSMQIMNGDMTRSTTYSYYLRPTAIGEYELPATNIETAEGTLQSKTVALQVLPNPDGIIQAPKQEQEMESIFGRNPFDNPFFNSPFDSIPLPPQQKKLKRKRKVTKI